MIQESNGPSKLDYFGRPRRIESRAGKLIGFSDFLFFGGVALLLWLGTLVVFVNSDVHVFDYVAFLIALGGSAAVFTLRAMAGFLQFIG